jgi:hypothetical protein
MRRGHAVWQPGIGFQGAMLQELDRLCPARREWANLIVLAMHDEHGNINGLEIIEEICLRQNPDAFILSLDAPHHALSPPISANTFRDLGVRTVKTVERHRDIDVELRPMVSRAIAKAVEHLDRQPVRVLLRLQQERRDGADQDRLRDPALAVLSNISRYLAATGRVADVNGILEIEPSRRARLRRRHKCPCRVPYLTESSGHVRGGRARSPGSRARERTSSACPNRQPTVANHDGRREAGPIPSPCSKSPCRL